MRTKLRKLKLKFTVTPLNIERLPRPNKQKVKSASLSIARAVAAEICGLAPYEKKAFDLIKSDQERKCRRFLKKRLGSLKRAKRKQIEIGEIVRQE